MKKVSILPVLIIFVLVIFGTSCKKDKDEVPAPSSYLIEYDGNTYSFLNGVIWDFPKGTYRPDHYTYAYFLPNPSVYSNRGNYAIPANDPPITLSFFLSTPDSEFFREETYEFVAEFNDWLDEDLYEAYLSNINGKYMLSDVLVGFDENGDGIILSDELNEVTDGTIKVTSDYLEFDLRLTNGKTVTGKSNPTFSKTPPTD